MTKKRRPMMAIDERSRVVCHDVGRHGQMVSNFLHHHRTQTGVLVLKDHPARHPASPHVMSRLLMFRLAVMHRANQRHFV